MIIKSFGGIRMIKILVVEDDLQLNHSVCTYLNNNGFETAHCFNPVEAYELLYHNSFQLILSDVMMPKIDGFAFAKTLRSLNKTIPILFMTARDDISSKQKGFNLGIDDYMVKPINLEELVLRIKALLRRSNIRMDKRLVVGNLVMDEDAMNIMVNNLELSITTREFKILYQLLSYPNKTFSRSQLMDEFWGLESETSLRAVDVYITKLRDKLNSCNGFKIVTVRGIGYKAVLFE